MATAKKLDSGSWRCLAFIGMENGKRKYKSFTAPTKKEAEYMASEYLMNQKEHERVKNVLTFRQGLVNYIESREAVLSPSTIKEYNRMQKNGFKGLDDKSIDDITQEDIQLFVNAQAKTHSPKSVKNMHGLISAVIKMYRPSMAINTTLPQKVPKKLYIPTDDDVKKLLSKVQDEEMLIVILLAAFGPMRRAEICGLESGDLEGKTIHVQRAVVMDKDRNYITKTTKSVAGNRLIPLPDFVYDKIKDKNGRIVNLNPNQIIHRFIALQRASGLPHFRFHDLRHYCASIQHAIGIPDAYIMQRGGWNSDSVLKQIYRHALDDKSIEMNDKANEHFSEICNTKCNTKKIRPL